jgi:hypothetical protein
MVAILLSAEAQARYQKAFNLLLMHQTQQKEARIILASWHQKQDHLFKDLRKDRTKRETLNDSLESLDSFDSLD